MFEYRYRHVTQISVKHVHILGVSYRDVREKSCTSLIHNGGQINVN